MINIQKNRLFQWFSLFLVASIVGVFMQFSGGDLLTSVIQTKQPEPFNGTALPLLSAPDWVALSAAEWKLPFDQIPESKKLNFPKYDEDQLKLSTSKLGWTGSDKQIRNAKITFPVPYMAGYDSDMGSHLAIDIKVPDFTPVYAIGNGTVVKVSKGTSGFGVHLVIKHDNFPSFSDSTKKTTYYSSYNHLSDIIVAQGDIVVKGQKIALTGHSGTSTTPHLHFQIDNDLAPWHPYWPFTFQEAQAAGYSFDEAVTAGLGRDKALATTINPLLYVQKYLNMTSLPESKPVEVTVDSSSNTPVVNQVPVANQTPVSESTPDEKITSAPAASPVPDPVPTVTDPPEESIVAAPEVLLPATALKIITDQTFSVGVEQKITVKAVDAHGDVVKNYQPKNGVSLVLGLGGATFKNNYFRTEDFVDGIASTIFVPTSNLGLRFRAFDGDISGESEILQGSVFKDVTGQSSLGAALTFLKNYHVVTGFSDGSFRPNEPIKRVEALKFIYEAIQQPHDLTGKLPFKDVGMNEWYTSYVLQAYKNKVVTGYPDKTFRPEKIVIKSEFLKMLYLAMDVKIELASFKTAFDDVPEKSWFSGYVADAQNKNILLETGNIFGSNQEMTRGEVAELMYRLIMLKISGQTRFTPGLSVSQDKIAAFFGRNS